MCFFSCNYKLIALYSVTRVYTYKYTSAVSYRYFCLFDDAAPLVANKVEYIIETCNVCSRRKVSE